MLGSRLRHFIGKGTHPPAMPLAQLHDPPLVPALASVRSSPSTPRPCRSLVMARADREFPFKLSDAEWRQRLNAEEFRVLRQGGTEAPGKGQYCKLFPQTGYFACRACKHPLYPATSKFPDSGWDAYSTCAPPPPSPPSPPAYDPENVASGFWSGDDCHVHGRAEGSALEAMCANCGSHLGHVFFGERHTVTNERH